MTDKERQHGAYVHRVREDTQRYIQSLLEENARLRRLAASMENETKRQQDERMGLQEQLLTLRQELERFKESHLRLQQQMAEIEAENQQYSVQFVEVEQRNNDLANLYVASYRLHGTLDRAQILTALEEIVINLVGSEEFAILEMDTERTALELVTSFGIDDETWRRVAVGSGVVGRAAASGETYLASDQDGAPGEERLTAAIPLKLDDLVVGMLVIVSLLPQKGGRLESLDRELFDLLATQAATALYCIALHRRSLEAEVAR